MSHFSMTAPPLTTPYLFKGSSPLVPNCCFSCGVGTTSGCWRRGWEIANTGSVNLCNRCGLKYKKQNGSFEEAHMEHAADTPGPASQGVLPYFPAPGSRMKLNRQDADTPDERPNKRRASKRQHSLNMDDFLSDDDEDSEQPATPAVADLPPVDPEIKPRDFSPVELSLTTFVMRRISCSARATYIIFWVQDRKEESYISVVGADYKGTGHFIYNNPPSYNVPDGLHVTNRNEATNWVVSQGAHLPAPDPEGKYVDLDLHDVELIKSGLSVWPKPPLDKPYNSYKVITEAEAGSEGEAKPGFKIVLLEDGTENTCVAVSSSAREDGSFILNAAEDFGGMRLESAEEAEEWVKYILGQSPGPDGPIKLSTILRFQNAKGEKLPLPDLPFTTARPVPRPARLDKTKLRSSTGMKMRHSVINGKFKQCAQCGGLGHDGRSCPMRPGGPSGLPHYDMEAFAYRDNLDTKPHPEVVISFEAFPELSEFVIGTPELSLVETVKGYAKTLSGFVDDEEPKEPILNNAGQPMEWVPTAKALDVLRDLEQMKVSLKLLEASGVPRPLARLRTHGNPEISAIAIRVTEAWKSLARRVASHAKGTAATA